MNRILEVNETNAYALVEPGVSYFDLYNYIQEHKLKVWIDCPDPGWGSVIGNAIDRGGGYTTANYRNHFDSHCGMEVVLPDGELLRTGMGAIPNAQTWQQYKSGCGPWIDGIFSQSNYGIVTKMGFWLMPEPEAYMRCTVSVPRYQDLIPLVEILNYVENSRISAGFPDIESPLLGYPPVGQVQLWNETGVPKMTDQQAQLLKSAQVGYSRDLEAYALSAAIPYWRLWLSFHGPQEVIEAQWQAAQRHFSRISGATFEVRDRIRFPLDRAKVTDYHEPELGVPSLRAFSIGARTPWNPTPSKGHMWFSPIIPRSGEAIFEANKVFSEVASSLGMPLFRTFTLPACFWALSSFWQRP
jgi:(+)-pinoresinol hydroxylase